MFFMSGVHTLTFNKPEYSHVVTADCSHAAGDRGEERGMYDSADE